VSKKHILACIQFMIMKKLTLLISLFLYIAAHYIATAKNRKPIVKAVLIVNGNYLQKNKYFFAQKLSVASLRKLAMPQTDLIYKTVDFGGGEWYYDMADHKSSDNTGTVIVTPNGKRIKRIYTDVVDVKWFGVAGDGTDETKKLQNAINNSYNKTLMFDAGKTYLLGGGKDNHVIINQGNITMDGNGCNIIPFNRGGGDIFFIFNVNASASNIVEISNITFKNFNYDAKYGPTIFINSFSRPYLHLDNINILNNHFKNFSGYQSIAVVTIDGPPIITADSSSKIYKNILIQGNSFTNFGKLLGIIVTKDYSKGNTSIAISIIDKKSTLEDRVLIGGYLRIASGEDTLTRPDVYAGTNAIYKITGYQMISATSGIIQLASGKYTNKTGFIQDVTNEGLMAPVKKNAAILPIIRYLNPTISYFPQFNFVPGSNVATRSLQTADENNRARNLSVGAEFYFLRLPGRTYTVKAIDKSLGSITLDAPFSSDPIVRNNETILSIGSLGNMVVTSGNIQAVVNHNSMIGGERAVAGIMPLMEGLTLKNNYTSLTIKNNYIKALYFPVEFGNNPFLGTMLIKYQINSGDSYFTVINPSDYTYLSKDINGDNVQDNLLTKTSLTSVNVDFANSLIEGDIIQFIGEKGLYIVTKIPTDFSTTHKIEVSRFDLDNNVRVAGGFLNTISGSDEIVVYENKPLKIGKQWNYLLISHNTIADAYQSLLSVGCYNTTIKNNTFIGTQNMTCELWGVNTIVDSNRFTNSRWNGEPDRIGVSGAWANIDIRGPLLNSTSNLHFTNNIVNTIDAKMGTLTGQNSFTYMASNPGEQIFDNNVFNGVGGNLFRPQQVINIDGTSYSSQSYYKLVSFKNNIVNTSLQSSSGSFICLIADKTEISNNKFNFLNGKSYDKLLSTDKPNPVMFPEKSYKVLINGNSITNAGKNFKIVPVQLPNIKISN
jgi:hypothetical protein